jgi:hypothetical protein
VRKDHTGKKITTDQKEKTMQKINVEFIDELASTVTVHTRLAYELQPIDQPEKRV